VTTTAYVCSGPQPTPCTTLQGSMVVRNSLDWKTLVDSGCTAISGDLVIDAPGVVSLDGTPAIRTIGGSLSAVGNAALTGLGLPALTSLGLDLTVQDNTALPECQALAFKDRLVGLGWPGTWVVSGNDTTATCPP
jgi:hypothetical protein